MFQEQTFDANGVQINFVEASASGQPIVLLHGTASEWQSFQPLIPVLARNFKVYALDLRGHGKSSWVSEKYRLFDYAEDIQCFLERHIGQPSIIYGHSLGAQIAIAVTSKAPAYVRALVLGDIPFYYHNMTMKDTMWYEPFMELHHVISSFHSAKEIDDYMAEQYPKMDEQRRKNRAGTLSRVDPGAVAAILEDRHVEGYDTDALLRKLTCQVLLIQGNPELGAALKDEDMAYMAERIQNCDIVHMQDIGHGLPSGESLSRVETFIESV
jgi:pimeloyl-ACP methyl ester carboxylesterase